LKKPILNLADAPVHSGSHGEHFEYSMSELADELGARSIGANVTRVPPGKAAFPFHHHHANEEHFFILSGTGVLRVGSQTYGVRPQDYIVHPAGPADYAHQLINTGSEDLVYLAISTLIMPEVVGYPDAAKTGVRIAAGQEPGARFLVSDAAKGVVGYWDGEDGREVAAVVAGSGPR
jgi:uncharacterized cupin superfamily protein